MSSKTAALKLCQVCEEKEKKYQCPKCNVLYCSLPCYKSHECKEAEKPKFEDPNADRGSLIFIDEDEVDVIPQEKLAQLAHSAELRNCLKNPHLRRFLNHVNTTHNPDGFMKIAMKEPIFLEFADACLKVVRPETETE